MRPTGTPITASHRRTPTSGTHKPVGEQDEDPPTRGSAEIQELIQELTWKLRHDPVEDVHR